jgi:mono/diheme cytochrome c family protein
MKQLFPTAALLFALLLSTLEYGRAATPKPTAADLAFYEQTVKPILAGACFECHSHEAKKFKGGLALDSSAAILKGGDTGPAVLPGDVEKSLLIKAVRYTDADLQMPPKNKKLGSDQIAALEKWVKLGAPMPEATGEKQTVRRGKITEEDKQWWAFVPVKKPAVPSIGHRPSAIGNAIDAFILQKLAAAQLTLSPPADRVTLARRVYFDLTGLPPTPFELDQFLKDQSADAYEKLVDKLLASPRYGEKQARHWLDLVRYAESDGYRADGYRQNAWRYRDYVVKSLNADMPYDQFVREQLAGDELYFRTPPEHRNPEHLVATGYFRAGIYEYNNRDVRGQWQRIIEDITDTSADVFLGVGLQCARCHDHKFDPLLQKDYYRFQAFFSPLLPREDLTLATPTERTAYEAKLAKWEAATADLRAELETLLEPARKSTEKSAIEMFVEDIRADILKPVAQRTPYEHQIAELAFRQVAYEFTKLDTKLKGDAKERVIALRKKLTEFDALKPAPLPSNYGATDVSAVAPPTLLPKGKEKQPVEPGYLSVLDEKPATVKPLANSTGRRSELARWLTAPENPLTARVMVNRLWQGHFGRGLAANASDFGKLGEKPSHPELLDWLAATFVEKGWSLKAMHRLMVTSATYRQASVAADVRRLPSPQPQDAKHRTQSSQSLLTSAATTDPENKLLSHFPVRRLEAEQIRDTILAVTGQLKFEPAGGPSTDQLTPRRSIYSKWLRNAPDPLLNVFDLAEPFQSVSQRNVTTTPPQALLLLNSQMMLRHARAFANRLEEEHPSSDEDMVNAAYRLAFSREPKPAERAAALQFLNSQKERLGGKHVAASTKGFAAEKMPYRDGVAAVISPDMGGEVLAVPDSPSFPAGDFTIEANILARTVDATAAVRTIAAKWSGDSKKPGWGFAITGAASRRKPQTLVLQIIGVKQDGSFGEEAIFSDQVLALARPYSVAASVKLATASAPGEVTFYVKDLSNDDEPLSIAKVPHKITGGFANPLALNLGGRSGKGGGFDGMIDDVRLSTGALKQADLLLGAEASVNEATVGLWQFESKPSSYKDASKHANDIQPKPTGAKATATTRASAMADLCHVLLNANEFVYVD